MFPPTLELRLVLGGGGLLVAGSVGLGLGLRFANDIPHGLAGRAAGVLAAAVVAEDVSARHAVLHSALLILAVGDVLPEFLHAGAHGGDGAVAVFVRTFGGMAEQE
jgi:hypothetical protein